MVTFKNDDASYPWLIANPDGFVLNSERTPTARCWPNQGPSSDCYHKRSDTNRYRHRI